MKMQTIIIMNFSNIYDNQDFYKNKQYKLLDCKDIISTNCICSKKAESQLKELIKQEPYNSIHFIDSGNYHYITKFWTDKIERDFVLVVFDHHLDMQNNKMNQNLNCGNWIIKAMENQHLKKAILIGAKYNDDNVKICHGLSKVSIFNQVESSKQENMQKITSIIGEYPIYISIDKDVMSSKVIETNWDQGTMSKNTLFKLLHFLILNNETIGLDICGACCDELAYISAIHKDDEFNLKLLNYLKMLSK
ncbi:MAG: arginase family protein [Bacilli bacterium]